MTTPLRPLAPSELGFVGPYPTTCAFTLSLEGNLDVAALTAAWDTVRAIHPELDAAVARDDGDWVFVAPAAGRAPLTTASGLTAAPVLVDPEVALGRLHVETAATSRTHRVTLAVNHALADGTYIYTLLAAFWSNYTALVGGAETSAASPQPFPVSAHDVLATQPAPQVDTGRHRLQGIRWYGHAPQADSGASLLPDTTSLRFSADTTARLAAAAKPVGMTALLSGILMCAERAGFDDTDPTTAVRLGAMTLVDLRRRVQPTRGATAVTNLVGASYAAVDLTMSTDPGTVGAAITDQVRADIAAGRCLAAMADAAGAPPEPPVVLSNLGTLTLALPPDVVGTELRPQLSMDATALQVPSGRRHPSPSATIYQAFTFAGRLSIEAITLGGTAAEATRAAVAHRVVELVNHAADLVPAA